MTFVHLGSGCVLLSKAKVDQMRDLEMVIQGTIDPATTFPETTNAACHTATAGYNTRSQPYFMVRSGVDLRFASDYLFSFSVV